MPSQERIEGRMAEVATLYADSCSTAKGALEVFLYDELAVQSRIEDPNALPASPGGLKNHADELGRAVDAARRDSALLTTHLRRCHDWVSPLWSATDKDHSRQIGDFCARQSQRLEKAKTRTDLDSYINDIRDLNIDIEDIKPIAKVLSARLSKLIQELEECKELAAGFCDKLAQQTQCNHWSRLQMIYGAALNDLDD